MTARLGRRAASWVSAALAAVALAAGCRTGDLRTAPRDAARAAVAHPGELTARVLLTGALHPTRALDVVVPSSDAFAVVIRWMIPDGASVQAGDRLFELDAGPVAAKLADARRQLAASRTQLRVMQRNQAVELASKRLAVRDAEIARDKARLRDALPADLVPQRDAAQASLRLRQTEAALRAAQAELATTTQQHALDLELKQIEVDKTDRASRATAAAIDALVVRAPRDGMVLIHQQSSGDGHKFRVGDSAQQGVALVSLPDLTRPMEVRASLSDVDDGQVSVHMTGRCTLDAYPAQPIACSVEQLAPIARPSPGRDPLRRSFEVTLALAGGGPALRPGMSVKVELDRPAIRGLVVPRTAVIPGAPAHVRLGSGEPREVALAGCDAQRCAIASGLADGDVVADGGAS